MEQMKRNSKLILFVIVLLDIVLTLLALFEWKQNGNVTLASWTFGASLITLLLLFISYPKLSDTYIYKWLLGVFFGIVFMGYWIFTNNSIGIAVALVASCTIILHSNLAFTYFITSLLCSFGCVVSIIRLSLGNKSLENVVMEVVTIIIFSLVWLLISREQTKKIKEDELLIKESLQRQDDQIQTLTHSSVILNNLINATNDLSTDLKAKMNLSAEAIEQISESSIETAKNLQYQTELSSHISCIIKELQNISETIQSNVKKSVETTESANNQVDGLTNSSEHIVNINNTLYQEMNVLKENISAIQAIIQTIANMSTQTNSLSLNASDEAAQAGEAGKRFAAAANEIRVLSDNTCNATKELESVLYKLVNSIEKTSVAVTVTVENIQQEYRYIECVDQKLGDIQNMLNITKTNVETLDLKFKDLTTANSDLMDHISNILATSEEVAARSESTVTMQKEGVNYSTKIADFLNKMKETAQTLIE